MTLLSIQYWGFPGLPPPHLFFILFTKLLLGPTKIINITKIIMIGDVVSYSLL